MKSRHPRPDADRTWRSRNNFSQTWQYGGGNARQRRRRLRFWKRTNLLSTTSET